MTSGSLLFLMGKVCERGFSEGNEQSDQQAVFLYPAES
jgi:hypothetical protein